MREEDVCLALFLDWLAAAHGHSFQSDAPTYSEPLGISAACSDGKYRLAVELRSLLDPGEEEVWQARRQHLQEQIALDLPGAYALWLPPGADLPSGASETLTFISRVREAAFRLQPGQRAEVALPVSLYLRKVRAEGSLMSVVGPLDTYWAKMSEHVRGSYDLDSTALHRLPEDEGERAQLLDRICDAANSIQESGRWLEIETVDAWTIQRLNRGQEVVIIGVPPERTSDMGLSVRRNFRRILAEAVPKLTTQDCHLRALIVLGFYPHMEQEHATTALRGYDPALYAGLDFLCLVADGRLKLLMEAPHQTLPWAGEG